MKKILPSLLSRNSTLVIEDDDPAYAAAPAQHIEPLPLPGSSCLRDEKPSAPAGSGQADPASYRNMESVLNRPGIACIGDQVVHNVPASNAGQVEQPPLIMPTLNFDPPGRKAKTAPPATQQEQPPANGVLPLPVPVMHFDPPGRKKV